MIAIDLHDDLGPILTAVRFGVGELEPADADEKKIQENGIVLIRQKQLVC